MMYMHYILILILTGAASIEKDAARYKTVYGLGEYIKEDIKLKVDGKYFSMNIDEATAKNSCRVLDILVGFFDDDLARISIYHLKSVELIFVNAETVTNSIISVIDEYGLDKSKLIAVLMDSCAVMRGSKAGVETKLRSVCPNLLDIDGDICHHAHNVAKKFTKTLQGHIESLFYDLNSHFTWSADQKEAYLNVCRIFQLPLTIPQSHCTTRWLSVFQCTSHTLEHWDVFIVFFTVT